MNRRNFIHQSCVACVAAGAGISLLSLSSCSSTKVATAANEKGVLRIEASQFTADTKSLLIRDKQLEYDVLLIKITETSYRALYMQCTHENNPVTYNSKGIYCLSHGSEFDMEGTVTLGPASRNLKQFPTQFENNSITIKIN